MGWQSHSREDSHTELILFSKKYKVKHHKFGIK